MCCIPSASLGPGHHPQCLQTHFLAFSNLFREAIPIIICSLPVMSTSGESVTAEWGQAHGATHEEASGAPQSLPGKEPTHSHSWHGTLVQPTRR